MGVAAPLRAQDDEYVPPIAADRPGQATPPTVVVPGFVQAELGVQYVSDMMNIGGERFPIGTRSIPAMLIRVGVFSSAELRVGVENRSQTIADSATTEITTRGIAAVSIGTKIIIASEDQSSTQSALLVTLGLPVGDPAFRPVAVAPSATLLMRTPLTTSTSLYYNLGGSWDGTNGSGTGTYAVSLANSFTDRLSGFAELYGTLATNLQPIHSTDAGLAYIVADHVQLDAFGGIGISPDAPNYFFSVGVSFRMPH
jgi:hypothetical protein